MQRGEKKVAAVNIAGISGNILCTACRFSSPDLLADSQLCLAVPPGAAPQVGQRIASACFGLSSLFT